MVAMQDAGVNEIVSSPQAYEAYLEIQANNPTYSAGNVALAYVQNPTVSQFGTVDHWKAKGRNVRDIEKNNGIQIFAKGSFSKGYTISNAYDISQTTGRDVVNRTIPVNSNEMDRQGDDTPKGRCERPLAVSGAVRTTGGAAAAPTFCVPSWDAFFIP